MSAPQAMAGNQAAGMGKLQAGLKMLMESLPQLQIGSELSNAVMDSISKIGKHIPQHGGAEGGNPQAMIQDLALMARDMKQQPQGGGPLQGLMGGGAGGPPPGAGGAPPPPMPAGA